MVRIDSQLKWALHCEGVNCSHGTELLDKRGEMGSGLAELSPRNDVVGEQNDDAGLAETDPEFVALGTAEAYFAGIQSGNPNGLQVPPVLGRDLLQYVL